VGGVESNREGERGTLMEREGEREGEKERARGDNRDRKHAQKRVRELCTKTLGVPQRARTCEREAQGERNLL